MICTYERRWAWQVSLSWRCFHCQGVLGASVGFERLGHILARIKARQWKYNECFTCLCLIQHAGQPFNQNQSQVCPRSSFALTRWKYRTCGLTVEEVSGCHSFSHLWASKQVLEVSRRLTHFFAWEKIWVRSDELHYVLVLVRTSSKKKQQCPWLVWHIPGAETYSYDIICVIRHPISYDMELEGARMLRRSSHLTRGIDAAYRWHFVQIWALV